jgi:hypothetical protein
MLVDLKPKLFTFKRFKIAGKGARNENKYGIWNRRVTKCMAIGGSCFRCS